MVKFPTWIALGLLLFIFSFNSLEIRAETPSETECRPYIEKALHELHTHDENIDGEDGSQHEQDIPDTGPPVSIENDDNLNSKENSSSESDGLEVAGADNENSSTDENKSDNENESDEAATDNNDSADDKDTDTNIDSKENDVDSNETDEKTVTDDVKVENENSNEDGTELESESEVVEEANEDDNQQSNENNDSVDSDNDSNVSDEEEGEKQGGSEEVFAEGGQNVEDSNEDKTDENIDTDDDTEEQKSQEAEAQSSEGSEAQSAETDDRNEASDETNENVNESSEKNDASEENIESEAQIVKRSTLENAASQEESAEQASTEAASTEKVSVEQQSTEQPSAEQESNEGSNDEQQTGENEQKEESNETNSLEEKSDEDEQVAVIDDSVKSAEDKNVTEESDEKDVNTEHSEEGDAKSDEKSFPEDDLLLEFEIPTNLRDRSHIGEILRLDDDSEAMEQAINKVADVVLKELKRIYENAIKPLETLYKYRDLSNRHFGDPEIFSKPLVLFMGPWSGGKSTILNYLTENEYTPNSIRTGAEPSPAYFNILMHGDEPEVLDGTQLAADWTFSGLQKFGQGLEDRLQGHKIPNKLLEKVNIVEIPGILEVRKQVSRLFPFNDACQWFIDRADIIFLVYDPSKLDVGPETEAILDQLKGREYQTRIVLNKGDQVKPEELLRVQSALIWNISPLMSSAQPPVMYTTSLWSHPYEIGAPVRLLQAQERALLRDLRLAIDKRIENKIASARRFAVRVRNHAKMVDCYLTTYYNHKTLFGNKNKIAEQIIQHPQNYHIYEGLSTLTNISRYDLPDPDVYRDFFRLNNLYEFKKLSETCTYFRGCPINKLDVAIAYDLPELVGKYKKLYEAALVNLESTKSKR